MIQILIILLSGSAIWLVGRKESWRRWGYIAGLAGQPFWFLTAYKNLQYGIILLCFWYTYCWCQGVWNFWIKPFLEDRKERNRLSAEFQKQMEETNRLIEQGVINEPID